MNTDTANLVEEMPQPGQPPSGLHSLADKWGDDGWEPAAGTALRQAADTLVPRHGLPPEAALLALLSALAGAAGTSHILALSQGRLIIAALHTLLVSRAPGTLEPAVQEAFGALTVRAVKDKIACLARQAQSGPGFDEQARQLNEQAHALEQEARKVQARQADSQYVFNRIRSGKQPWGREPDWEEMLARAGRLRADAADLLADHAVIGHPGSLMDSLVPEELLAPSAWSFDASLFDLDLTGTTWRCLMREKPARRSLVARQLLAGWAGTCMPRDGRPVAPSAISTLAVLDPATYEELARCETLTDVGLWQRLVAIEVEPQELDPGPLPAATGLDGFNHLLERVYRQRTHKSQVRLSLGAGAEQAHLRFSQEVALACQGAPASELDALNLLPVLALKIALLLGFEQVQADTSQTVLDEPALRRAISLSLRLARGGADLRRKLEDGSQWSGCDDEAVLELVMKVRLRGRCKRRDLLRAYHNLKMGTLAPRLEKALRMGLLLQDGPYLVAALGAS